MLDNVSPPLIISFSFYTVMIVVAGLAAARRRKKTADDYYLASRELGPWTSALSASASSESGWVMMGLVGVAFTKGISALWLIPGCMVGYLFNWYFVADRIRQASRKTGARTLPEYLALRFGEPSRLLRILSVGIIACAMIAYVSAQMNASGKAFEAMFALPYWLGVFLGAAIILIYTTTGGFRASVWTDAVQGTFMAASLVIISVATISVIGGIRGLITGLQTAAPELLSASAGNAGFGVAGFVLGWIAIGWGYPGQPHVLARFMGTKDTASIRAGGVVAFVWSNLVFLGAILLGLAARVYFGQLNDPEQALPLITTELMPPVIGGFVLASVMAAIWSTADSQLLVVASTVARDFERILRPAGASFQPKKISSGGTSLRRTDVLAVLILGVIAAFFAVSQNRVIFTFVLYAWSVLGASFGPVVILGLAWKKTTRQGAIAGLIVGSTVSVLWKSIPVLSQSVYELVPAFLLSFAGVVFVSLMTHQTVPSVSGEFSSAAPEKGDLGKKHGKPVYPRFSK